MITNSEHWGYISNKKDLIYWINRNIQFEKIISIIQGKEDFGGVTANKEPIFAIKCRDEASLP